MGRFGLPAENAAIQHNIHPTKWTRENIDLCAISCTGSASVTTGAVKLRHVTPSITVGPSGCFCGFTERGLAYRKRAAVNWCPDCATVLANEQVIQGLCERCD